MPQGLSEWALFSMRWILPAAIFLTGVIVIAVGGGSTTSIEGGFMFMGAAFAVLLMNFFFRMGAEDTSREREDAARAYFDEHGHWPDQARR